MSGMRGHAFHPALPGHSLSPRAELKKGNGHSGRYSPERGSPFFILLVARGVEVVHLLAPGATLEPRPFAEAEVRDGRLYLCGTLVA